MRKKKKLTRLLGIAFLLVYGHLTLAQNNLFQVVSVDFRQQRLEDALQLLSQKNGFNFSYSSDIIPKDSIVSYSASSITVKELLDILLKGNYEYKESLNYIILRPAPYRLKLIPEEVAEKDNLYTVEGYVVDESTGAKVTRASVYEKRLVVSTLTDNQGYFKLRIRKKEDDIALTVSKELYRDITIVILPSTEVKSGGRGDFGYDPSQDPDRVERTTIGRLLVSSRQKIQSLNLSGFFANKPFQASLTPGLSTHGIMNSQVINKFSLNLIGGYTTGVEGLEVAGIFNINKRSVEYVQAAGIFNVVGGSVKGVQVAGINNTVFDSVQGVEAAGLYNEVRGDFLGAQMAGFLNTNKKSVRYFQAAGAINLVGGSMTGAQFSGLTNMVEDSVTGAQATGLFNDVKNDLTGVQIAGLFNRVRKEVEGVQISGLFNYSKDRMEGLQLSGGVNIANNGIKGLQLTGVGNISRTKTDGMQLAALFNSTEKLTGVQFGIINIADSSSGVSIGILNFIKTGYHKVSIFSNEVMNTNVAYKSGNSKLYSILTGGMNISGEKKAYSLGFGLGHDFILNQKFSISAELTSSTLYLGNWSDLANLSRVKSALNIQLTKKLSIFAGPAYNFYASTNYDPVEGYKHIESSGAYSHDFSENLKGWIGFEGGITLF
ncbi:MAG TPA: hypothetical protein VD908_17065 [Cytophagales bacterium]|nr:hypothetical protein [Cytophagales bacterium]